MKTYEYVIFDAKGAPGLQGCYPLPMPNAAACAARLLGDGYAGVAIVRETKRGGKLIAKEIVPVERQDQ
jgi:nucleoside recognition membrane protein YjiH